MEVLTLHGPVRYRVLIVIELASRRVEIGGIVYQPTGVWMVQAEHNLLDVEDGFLHGMTHLIIDRDPGWRLRVGSSPPLRAHQNQYCKPSQPRRRNHSLCRRRGRPRIAIMRGLQPLWQTRLELRIALLGG